jgi:hypothetical protein
MTLGTMVASEKAWVIRRTSTMKRIAATLILASTLAALAGGAADQPSGASPLSFQRLDTNRDGYVTRDEAREAINRGELDFDKLDVDGDGKLSEPEMTKPSAGKVSFMWIN